MYVAANHFEYYPPTVCHGPSTKIGEVAEIPTPVKIILGNSKRGAFGGFLLPERIGCLLSSVEQLMNQHLHISLPRYASRTGVYRMPIHTHMHACKHT